MSSHPLLTHQRQVHLDFHTSPFITDVASEFDARAFAQKFKRAHVNSVTVFAKCHHGMSYYPTKVGTPHPGLKRKDLLGEMIEALHREGIRAPVYTTIVWEEDVAHRHPEWRQLNADGTLAIMSYWRCNNLLHPDYQDYIETHVRELLANYDIDGFFFDIVLIAPHACWSDASVRFREKHGLLGRDDAVHARFESLAQSTFARKFSRIIRGLNRDCTIFYNTPLQLTSDADQGVRPRSQFQTHWELESLPSGSWGYLHFPRLARAFDTWGKPWLGMTGRFQKMWGDFGGLKPVPALEYECFRSQALGGANSVGDQLPPRGRLDAGAYDLIGEVYAQCAAAEPFYAGSARHAQIGIVAPGRPDCDSGDTDKSLEGAVQICEEAHYDAVVLDDSGSFVGLDLIILPDSVVVTAPLKKKLAGHVSAGGKIIFSGKSGFNDDGRSDIPGVALRRIGTVELFPTYWRTKAEFSTALSRSDRVVYHPGENVNPGRGATVWIERVLPYFKRDQIKFCSHAQTPPRARADAFPAALGGKKYFYFADPIFREYRQCGNIAVRDGCVEALRRLIGPAPIGEGLPKTILSVPRRRGPDLILTLLHYIPTRKALEIDMIEERSSFAGEVLRLPKPVKAVTDFETKAPLDRQADGSFLLPAKKGRLLLKVPGFFASSQTVVG